MCCFTIELQFPVKITFTEGYALPWSVHILENEHAHQGWCTAPVNLQQSRWELLPITALSCTRLLITLRAILFVGLVCGTWHQNTNCNEPKASVSWDHQEEYLWSCSWPGYTSWGYQSLRAHSKWQEKLFTLWRNDEILITRPLYPEWLDRVFAEKWINRTAFSLGVKKHCKILQHR